MGVTAVYPGSFDPTTYGHLDIIKRASGIVDKLIVAVLDNSQKSPMFSVAEREEHLRTLTKDFSNVEVASFSGLLVDFVGKCGAKVVIRGLRAVTDFESEFQMALINRTLDPDIETLFISTSTQYLYLSSSVIKEIASFGGNIDEMVPEYIKLCLKNKTDIALGRKNNGNS